MIEESIEDFRKRYRNTYLFLEIKNKKHLVRYDDDDSQSFQFYSIEYGNLLVNKETARNNISFYFPDSGLYNINNKANYFTRYPARQWRRAPCKDNTIFQEVSLTRHFENDSSFNFEKANSVFFPKYPTSTKEAIETLTHNPIAINKKFGIIAGTKKYDFNPILLYNTTPVGVVNNKNNSIVVKYKPLLQEVKDHYYAKEPEWTIVE